MDDFYHTGIGRHLKNLSSSYVSITSFFGISNFILSKKGKFTGACRDYCVFIYHFILQGSNHGHKLKGRTWLMSLAYSIIEFFKVGVYFCFTQIGNCFYLSSLSFHNNYSTMVCFELFQLFQKSTVSNVLNVDIHCSM